MPATKAIETIVEALGENFVFGAFEPARLSRLVTAGARVELAPGAALFVTGDEADALYVILSGEVAILLRTEEGREVRLAALGRGAVVGEMGVLDGLPRSAEALADGRVELWRIGREAVLAALREQPEAALALLAEMAQRLRATDALVQQLTELDLGRRLARLLAASDTPIVARSQGEIARLIGGSRERVNRRLAEWRNAGWVALGPYGVKILNRAALAHHGRSSSGV